MTPEQQKLVRDNALLATKLATVMWEKNRDFLDRDEAISNAYVGLIAAARNWDPTRPDINPEDLENGKAFSGYARHRIIGTIRDWLRKEDYVSRTHRRIFKKMRSGGLDDGLTLPEIAENIEEPLDQVKSALNAVAFPPVSIHRYVQDQDYEGDHVLDLPGEVDTESSIVVDSVIEAGMRKLQSLGHESRLIIALRYYEKTPLYEIADYLGKSTSRVSALHSIAVLEILSTMKEAVEID